MAKKATNKKLHNLPEEVTVWREGKQGEHDALLCCDDKPDDAGLDSGTFVGVYRLVRVGEVRNQTIIDPIDGGVASEVVPPARTVPFGERVRKD